MPRLPCVLLLCCLVAAGQHRTGELRLEVSDAGGLALPASGDLLGQATHVHQTFVTDHEGRYIARGLPFGLYRLTVTHEGFAPSSELIEIRSEVPLVHRVVLGVAAIETSVNVTPGDTLLEPHRTGSAYYIGSEALEERRASAPARGAIELVESEPGWILEANGVLHPRGAEYNTQYVIDGVPVLDNRSPAFAPAIETQELQSMTVLTANYPAEYGRKLGGVIEVATERDTRPGFHAKADLGGGSFGTQNGFFTAQYPEGRLTASLSADGAHTERFLDPPTEENYSNRMSGGGVSARLEADLTANDRLRAYFHSRRAGFLVPNELVQEEAGQRQDRTNGETMGQLAYQRILSPRAMLSARAMVRELAASLWSNDLSTPILAGQDRGFREGYAGAALSYSPGPHEFKFGGDALFTSLHEGFAYQITDPSYFDQDLPAAFGFSDRRQARQQAWFAQDLIRLGNWTFSAGLRWDHYRLLVDDQALSPRLGIAWYWRAAGLVLRASYDRAFETPSIENLLLASSRAAQSLTAQTTGLPVPPSRGNFYQAGFSKSLWSRLRLNANYFRREIRNFSDDDVFLNTGVGFPISFASASIHGYEAKLELPNWGPFSAFASYSNLTGTGWLPITGGLFLEPGSVELLHSTSSFPITQDQRNTAQAQVRYQPVPRAWASVGGRYGSGLPAELPDNAQPSDYAGQYSPRLLERVNFDRGRVRPNFSLDASVGVRLWKKEHASVKLQADALNLTNRLNLFNFAGLFSGTALANPRSVAVRLQSEF